jgi:hypothetical protein
MKKFAAILLLSLWISRPVLAEIQTIDISIFGMD